MKDKIKIDLIETSNDFIVVNMVLLSDGIINPQILKYLELPIIKNEVGVVLSGKLPNWLFSHLVLHYQSNLFCAIYNPRNGAIIVNANTPKYSIGNIIENDLIINHFKQQENQKRTNPHIENTNKTIALIGPPHSGKSVFLQLLVKELQQKDYNNFNSEFYIIRACPDGEGNWSGEVAPELVKILRYKNAFTDEFVNSICSHLIELKKTKKYVFVDCGGIIDKKNQRIFNLCSHSIVVAKDSNSVCEWIGAAKSCELIISAIVLSSLENVSNVITENPLKINYGPTTRDILYTNKSSHIPDNLLSNILYL